ncbi:MAG: pantoate--beta-alanine ligase [Hyphomonadaceae bacterium]|nr:pantoate--beta-alanine ligase [Hyphomonadaceae bacterium]
MVHAKRVNAQLTIVRDVNALRAQIAAWRSAGERSALVPTMGALHEGHLSLVRLARTQAKRVVASLFVNPKQFAAHEDLGTYPRDEQGDAEKLAGAGCDLLYAPEAAAMYPPGFATSVSVAEVSAPLEGEIRPHFFGGVATVVAKLFLQAPCDVAVFGEKDYQQLLVVKRMARDLDFPIGIIGGETVREADGLAMSSRNAYLSEAERATAGKLNVILREAVARLETARGGIPAVEKKAIAQLTEAGFAPVDYVSVRDADDLGAFPGDIVVRPARILAAAWIGKTRLIDNMPVKAFAA